MVWLIITSLVVLTAYIDYKRIKAVFGKQVNISKVFTVLIAIALYSPVVIIFGTKYIIPIVTIRGILYDIALNLFRKLPIDYVSETTNSITDRKENRIFTSFWIEKFFYLIILILSQIL
jgi:hypothetical protein